MEQQKTRRIWLVTGGALWTLSWTIAIGCVWYKRSFSTGFMEMLYTMTRPMTGTSLASVMNAVLYYALPVLLMLVMYLALARFFTLNSHALRFWQHKPSPRRFLHKTGCVGMAMCIGLLPLSLSFADQKLEITSYLTLKGIQSKLYEKEYVSPDSVAVTAPAKKKNLILLYMESMETAYASVEEGGEQAVSCIPRLARLAKENVSFSETKRLGGFRSVTGTTWTMAAILASTSGIPFSFPVGGNDMDRSESFAPNLVTLGDILERDGYRQMFLCGSDATFGGRRLYYEKHGGFEISDLLSAKEDGVLPEDYFVWWGYEDRVLFDIAKDELTSLAAGDQPFHLSMLTSDLHHQGGYVCEECGSDREEPTANVCVCTDRQAAAFIAWCEEQPWWADTVMVIIGDHPRMDTNLVGDKEAIDRPVYNCFLNASGKPKAASGRLFSTLDMFPTILSAMGYRIEGNRLGLGVDLFSGRRTLLERKGIAWLNEEIAKDSVYYNEHFAQAAPPEGLAAKTP